MSGEPAPRQQQNSSDALQQDRVKSATTKGRSAAAVFAEIDEQARERIEASIGREAWAGIMAKILPGHEPREVK